MQTYRRWRRRSALALLGAATLALGAGASAQAATIPSVATGNALDVSYGTAVLTGSVRPNGADTSYYFQYGPTRAYGGQSAIADAGSGTHWVSVRLGVAGLQPITQYHYRLVAVNGQGVQLGSDHTFLTHKVPLSLAIEASPNPVLFGGTVLVQGTLSGTGNAGRAIVLQANGFPFTGGFQNVGNALLTSATGSFRIPLLGMTQATQLRVVTTGAPAVASPVASVSVAVRVSSHIRGTGRRHYARFYGTVAPAENGAQVGILRIERGRGVPVAGATLHPLGAGFSHFNRVVRVSRGVYRVLVVVKNGAQISNYGQPIVIG